MKKIIALTVLALALITISCQKTIIRLSPAQTQALNAQYRVALVNASSAKYLTLEENSEAAADDAEAEEGPSFFSRIKSFFSGSDETGEETAEGSEAGNPAQNTESTAEAGAAEEEGPSFFSRIKSFFTGSGESGEEVPEGGAAPVAPTGEVAAEAEAVEPTELSPPVITEVPEAEQESFLAWAGIVEGLKVADSKLRFSSLGYGFYEYSQPLEVVCEKSIEKISIQMDLIDGIINFFLGIGWNTRNISAYCVQ